MEYGGVSFPWDSATVLCLIIIGAALWVAFALYEWKLAKYPVMPTRIFRHVSNAASLGVCFCHAFVFIAGAYYLPLYFQAVLGATPILSGVYVLPTTLALSFASIATGIFIRKTGLYRPPIFVGLVLMIAGYGLFINFGPTRVWTKLILYQVVAGLGTGPNFQAPLIALQSGIHPRDIATATATFGFTRNTASAISVVIGGVVFQSFMAKHEAALAASVGPQLAARLAAGGIGAAVPVVDALPPPQRDAVRAAAADSLRYIWILYVAVAAAGLAVALLVRSNELKRTHQETRTGIVAERENREAVAQENAARVEAKAAKRASHVSKR